MSFSRGLRVPVPCIKGACGERLDCFQAVIAPSDIVAILGHDPRSKNWALLPKELQGIYSHLQRKTSKERRDSLAGYITQRILGEDLTIGAFPALAIGMTRPAEFTEFERDLAGTNAGMGVMQFDISGRSPRVLLDGLGRVTAALDLLENGQDEVNEKVPFMVTFYAPTAQKGHLQVAELGQLFFDFNFLAVPINKGQAVDLDQSNIYITLTNKLAEASIIKSHGGVEPRAASLGKKSTALVAKQVLLKFVKAACEGDVGVVNVMRRSPQDGKLTTGSLGELHDQIVVFLEGFAQGIGDRFADRDFVHLSASGWGALGMVFFDLHFNLELPPTELRELGVAAGCLDWSRSNSDWIGYLGGADSEAGGRLGKVFGGRAIERILDYVRLKIGIAPKLKAIGVPVRDIETRLKVGA